MSTIERWVEKFRGFGAQPSPDRCVALFDPEGTVFDSGMERPLKVAEMAPHMEGILTLPSLPAYEPVIDQELEQAASSQVPVSGLSPAEFLEQYTRLWQEPKPRQFAAFYHPHGRMLNPDMSRPLRKAEIPGYYAFLLSSIPDLRLERLAWAGDQHVLYVEWHGSGAFLGKPFHINLVDRFEFLDGRVISGQAYFDTVVLLSVLDPSINSVHFAPSAGATSK